MIHFLQAYQRCPLEWVVDVHIPGNSKVRLEENEFLDLAILRVITISPLSLNI